MERQPRLEAILEELVLTRKESTISNGNTGMSQLDFILLPA